MEEAIWERLKRRERRKSLYIDVVARVQIINKQMSGHSSLIDSSSWLIFAHFQRRHSLWCEFFSSFSGSQTHTHEYFMFQQIPNVRQLNIHEMFYGRMLCVLYVLYPFNWCICHNGVNSIGSAWECARPIWMWCLTCIHVTNIVRIWAIRKLRMRLNVNKPSHPQ